MNPTTEPIRGSREYWAQLRVKQKERDAAAFERSKAKAREILARVERYIQAKRDGYFITGAFRGRK